MLLLLSYSGRMMSFFLETATVSLGVAMRTLREPWEYFLQLSLWVEVVKAARERVRAAVKSREPISVGGLIVSLHC